MPKINIPQSQVMPNEISTQRISSDLFTSGGQQIQETAQQLEQINQHFKGIRDFREESLSTIEVNKEIAGIKVRASEDDDINNLPNYQQEIDDAVSRGTNKITDPTVRANAALKFSNAGLSASTDMSIEFNRKAKVQAEGSFYSRMANYSEIAKTATIEELDQMSLEFEDMLSTAEKNEIITPKTASSIRSNYKDTWNNNRKIGLEEDVYKIMDRDPASAIDILKSQEVTDELGVKKRNKLLEEARSMFEDEIDNNRRDNQISFIANNRTYADRYISGDQTLLSDLFNREQDLLLDDSDEARQEVKNIRSFRDSIIKKQPKSPDQQSLIYNDLLDRMDNMNNKRTSLEDFLNLQNDIMRSGFSGEIDNKQYKDLIDFSSRNFTDLNIINKADGWWGVIPVEFVPGEHDYDRPYKVVNKYIKDFDLKDRPSVKANFLRNMFRLIDLRGIKDIEDNNEKRTALEKAAANALGYEEGKIYNEGGVRFKFIGITDDGSIDVELVE